MIPMCPRCGKELDYDEQLETRYEGDSFSAEWRGGCSHCQIIFTWWENFTLTSIENMEQEELE